jgi:hypothetical protein
MRGIYNRESYSGSWFYIPVKPIVSYSTHFAMTKEFCNDKEEIPYEIP